jgi:hypothetical protein
VIRIGSSSQSEVVHTGLRRPAPALAAVLSHDAERSICELPADRPESFAAFDHVPQITSGSRALGIDVAAKQAQVNALLLDANARRVDETIDL